jgi:hypothetical protein
MKHPVSQRSLFFGLGTFDGADLGPGERNDTHQTTPMKGKYAGYPNPALNVAQKKWINSCTFTCEVEGKAPAAIF